jgi:hypothetical protein
MAHFKRRMAHFNITRNIILGETKKQEVEISYEHNNPLQ